MFFLPVKSNPLLKSHTLGKWFFIFLPIGIVFILMIQFILFIAQWRINLTPSMPIGIYQKSPQTAFATGDTLAACLSEPIAKIARANHYLTRGTCPSNSAPVLKKAIAVPNDTVTITDNEIIVNGKHYPALRKTVDRLGHPIVNFIKTGTYKSKGYWLYGAHTPNRSWDSRYFGEIPVSNVIGIFKPVWVF